MTDQDTMRFPWEEEDAQPPAAAAALEPRADDTPAAVAEAAPSVEAGEPETASADDAPSVAGEPETASADDAPSVAGEPETASADDAPSVAGEPEAAAVDAPAEVSAVQEPAHASPAAGGSSPTTAHGRRAETPQRQVVRKEYYAISEVADLVALPAHVLRYWESQFSVLNPSKNRSGNRVYQRKEIKLILLVKQLLHDEKYTVEGAKQKLEQLRRGGSLGDATTGALDRQLVAVLRDELQQVSELLTAPEG
jgi:DNA-binding transcriptional MerR regulator